MPKPVAIDDLPKSVEEFICFNIYSAGHAFNRAYSPMLKELNLTYPQYIALTILWEEDGLNIGELCDRLRLESNTVTPLLKRLESLGHIKRKRGEIDERQVFVSLTPSGRALQKHAANITKCIIETTGYDLEKLEALVKNISNLRDNVMRATAVP